jgi:hypothetical protein
MGLPRVLQKTPQLLNVGLRLMQLFIVLDHAPPP